MITVYKDPACTQVKEVHENVNDIRQLLEGDEFMALLERDAIRVTNVLGTKNASYRPVYWRRNSNPTGYTDYIVTVQ